jgi:hypothetical protein
MGDKIAPHASNADQGDCENNFTKRILKGIQLFDTLTAAVRASVRYEFPRASEAEVQQMSHDRLDAIRRHMKGPDYHPVYANTPYSLIEEWWNPHHLDVTSP